MSGSDISGFDAENAELQTLVQFAFLRRPFAALLSACAEADLGLIVLKGAALAETVYPSPVQRPFGDLDVLVRAEDAVRAFGLLTELGYVCDADAWAELEQGRSCEANFFRHVAPGTVVVELHTDLLNNPLLRRQVRVDIDGLWTRSRPATLAGQDARVLGPEDQLAHLCLHLAGHYFDAPKSVQDIAQVCRVQSVDWPLFGAICRDAHAKTIGYCGLFAAISQYGTEVPAFVLHALAPRSPQRLKKLVSAPRSEPLSEAARFRLLWRFLDRPEAKLFAVRHLLFPNRAWLHAHYFYDLPETALDRRLPIGVRLYACHIKFLGTALLRIRK